LCWTSTHAHGAASKTSQPARQVCSCVLTKLRGGTHALSRGCRAAALTRVSLCIPVCVCMCWVAAEMLFDAVAVSGDYLLASVTVYDAAAPQRLYLSMDLNTAAVDGNTPLVRGLVSQPTCVCAPCALLVQLSTCAGMFTAASLVADLLCCFRSCCCCCSWRAPRCWTGPLCPSRL
jgi:hypothetical protein